MSRLQPGHSVKAVDAALLVVADRKTVDIQVTGLYISLVLMFYYPYNVSSLLSLL